MEKAVRATVNTPKSRGVRIRATTAVVATLDKRITSVLKVTQRAPRRTLADRGGESPWDDREGPETMLREGADVLDIG
jgi:hypothetical protein